MARIELRNCTIRLKDGLAGTAAANNAAFPVANDTSLTIGSTTSLNTDVTNQIPVGANFTYAGDSTSNVYTVQTRTPSSGGATTSITFLPGLGAPTSSYSKTGTLTFSPQVLQIKIGEGDLKYTENYTYTYDLDRGNLDQVREGDEVPVDVSFDFVYEHVTTGTNEFIAPMDAVKRANAASEWVSSATDKCEPYCVDVEVDHVPPCGTNQIETTIFPDFRADKKEVSLKDATISLTGRCNVTRPVVTRTNSLPTYLPTSGNVTI